MVSYYRPIVTLCVKCTVFEIFAFQNYRDLETRVRGHSRSSKVTPFDSLPMVSFYRPIVTLCLKYTVFEIWRHIGWKSSKNPNPSHLIPFFGWPLANFSTSHTFPETESWGTFHDPAFALLVTIPACDRRTDRRTLCCRKDPRVARVKSNISAMDSLVVVKFQLNIANRWLFIIQRKIMAIILYSWSYFDMFRGAVFSGHSVH